MEAVTDGRLIRGAGTRERILAAARALFGEDGFEATSIEDVLAGAGVSRGALYHHFANKAELFDAVLEQVNAELAGRAANAARRRRDPFEQLRAGSHAWLAMALDPAVQRIVLRDPPTAVGWARWRELDERYWLGGLRAGLARLEAEGRIPSAQAAPLARLLYAALNEASLYIAYAEDQAGASKAAGAAIDTLLERLLK